MDQTRRPRTQSDGLKVRTESEISGDTETCTINWKNRNREGRHYTPTVIWMENPDNPPNGYHYTNRPNFIYESLIADNESKKD